MQRRFFATNEADESKWYVLSQSGGALRNQFIRHPCPVASVFIEGVVVIGEALRHDSLKIYQY
jgi:hypothetical protein